MQAGGRKRLLGYTDKLTVRPGEKIQFKISSEGGAPYMGQLVKLVNGDAYSPAAKFKEIEIDSSINARYDGREQVICAGSYIEIEDSRIFDELSELTIVVNLMPTAPQHGRQYLISRWDEQMKAGWFLCIDSNGQLAFEAADTHGQLSMTAVAGQLHANRWYTAAVRASWLKRTIRLDRISRMISAADLTTLDDHATARELVETPKSLPPLLMAAAFGGRTGNDRIVAKGCFNGRLEAPVIYRGSLSDGELATVIAGEPAAELRERVVADWDFSADISGTRVIDRSGNGLHGTIHNLPLRAVKGSRWDGSTMEWPHAPGQYGAIHFHSDDLYDCGWATDITYEVPADLRSGIYALRLRSCAARADDEEYLPFFVAAPKNKPQAEIAFLVPTYTYAAYGNVQLLGKGRRASAKSDDEYYGRAMTGPGTREYVSLMENHVDLGLSLYDCHADDSPVHFSSWLRPLLNMRPKSLLWTFCADLLLVDWLEEQSFQCDVISDDLLQEEGVELLRQYRVVLTGNHPEYQTTRQMDAFQSYLGQGGRLMYLGGNGFYWRTAVHRELPGVIEVRRGLTGTGTWQSEAGESCLAFSGEVGGIWRDLGRAPQSQFGIGFIAEGPDSSYYRIMAEARQGRAAFLLEGVQGDIIGDFGVFNGGAAGQEIDRTDAKRGTPPHAIVVARSERHGSEMIYVIEEMRSNWPVLESYRAQTCAEIMFFETRSGGAVFAVGSMAWCGSLSHNNYQNNVSTITANALRRFCNAEPFVVPLGLGASPL